MSQHSRTFIRALVGAAVLAAASNAFTAQEARTMLVSATIPGGCTLTVPPMAFGTLNVATGGQETKQVTATYKCASGIVVNNFSVGGSSTGTFTGSMSGTANPTASLPYTITWNSQDVGFTGTGFTTGKDVLLSGVIAANSYTGLPPDNYSQSVIVAINF